MASLEYMLRSRKTKKFDDVNYHEIQQISAVLENRQRLEAIGEVLYYECAGDEVGYGHRIMMDDIISLEIEE